MYIAKTKYGYPLSSLLILIQQFLHICVTIYGLLPRRVAHNLALKGKSQYPYVHTAASVHISNLCMSLNICLSAILNSQTPATHSWASKAEKKRYDARFTTDGNTEDKDSNYEFASSAHLDGKAASADKIALLTTV